jgi:hypothetical protein
MDAVLVALNIAVWGLLAMGAVMIIACMMGEK